MNDSLVTEGIRDNAYNIDVPYCDIVYITKAHVCVLYLILCHEYTILYTI